MAGPILGYFGVVDERLDYELIRRIAFLPSGVERRWWVRM